MTRRSKISQTDDLMRAQRRDVPNARLWSESPVPPTVEWDGVSAEPGTEEEDF